MLGQLQPWFYHPTPKPIRISINEHPSFRAHYSKEYSATAGNVLGTGTYGEVIMLNERKCVKKIVSSECLGVNPTTLREIALVKDLCHINILRLTNVFKFTAEPDTIYMEMERATYDLLMYLEIKGPMSVDEVNYFSFQLMHGVNYCHSNRVIHRDLKPGNILIMECRRSGLKYLKIADWGLCRQTSIPLKQYTPEVQTILYRAPELVLLKEGYKDYMTEVDIWSCALIIIEMFIAKPYLQTETEAGLINQWKQKIGFPPAALYGDKTSVIMKGNGYDADLMGKVFNGKDNGSLAHQTNAIKMIKGMLDWDPLKRLRADECLLTPFLQPMFRDERIKRIYTDIAAEKDEYTEWEEEYVGPTVPFNKAVTNARELITPPNDNDVDAMDITNDYFDQGPVAIKKQRLQSHLASP